ncbi:MAG: MBOAT family O-acyltransferase [Pseudomonadota bacterium]
MLFISHIYFCLFLPVVLLVYHLLVTRHRVTECIVWLVVASLFFYGWWNPQYLVLIVGSILFNYALGSLMSRSPAGTRKGLLLLALAGNLGLLGYFKYANFVVEASNQLAGSRFHLEQIVLPLAISFFTLQQVAYVVDAYRGDARPYPFLRYSLFVCFFPQLIAGPIVHHRKLIPQFAPDRLAGIDANQLALGISIFVAGMFKKVVIADQLVPWVSLVFDATDTDYVTGLNAWIATYAYTFQLYFDFSGYSDMAIGAAMMFGIKLPINFNSPYKAANIRDIWRRWHITLSDFVMRYVYAPLGAGKRGHARMYVHLFIAFLVTGIWHGAGWNFVVFGCLHGTAVLLHQAWKDLGLRMPQWLGVLLTFNFWALALVIFRSPTLAHAQLVYQRMLGGVEVSIYTHDEYLVVAGLLVLLALVWRAPNTAQIFRERPAQDIPVRWRWQATAGWGLALGLIAAVLVFQPLAGARPDQAFIYFQF